MLECLKCKQKVKSGTAVFTNGEYTGILCSKCSTIVDNFRKVGRKK